MCAIAPSFIPAETASSETVAATGGSSSGADGDLRDGREAVDSGERSTLSSSGGSTTGATVQRPAPFDGKGAWDVYHTQFEMLA